MNTDYDLGSKIKSGAFWIYIQGWFGAVLHFASGIALARLMEPEDFGVFHAVNAYSSLLVQQVNFGMPGALLQARELEDSQWNSAFWVMEAIAALCTILVLFFSGWLSQFYADDRYTTIIRLSCVNLFIMPYMQINGSILRRSMDYKTVSHILMFSSFFSIGVSVTLAALGLGPYSLLISGIVSSFLSALLMKRKAPWQPQLAFNWEGLKPLVRFGWRLHLNKSLNMFATRVDNMMVGSIMGVGQLGYYNRAFNLSRMPVTELMGRLYQIFFTGLSRIQNNLEYSQKMLQKIVGTMCLAIFPFLIILILQGENVIVILYGEKWLPSAMPLKIMALGSFPYLIAVTLGSLSDAQNLVARETPIQVFNALATIVAVLIGSRWGLEGISWGIAVKSFLLLILLQQMIARSHVKLKFVRLIQAIIPAIIASMAGFAAGGTADYVLHHFYPGSAYLHISLVILAVFTTYGITIFTIARFKPDNEMLASNLKIFKEIFTKLRARLFGLFKSN